MPKKIIITNQMGIDFRDPIECVSMIALKEISFVVSYYNVSEALDNNKVSFMINGSSFSDKVPDGLYNYKTYLDALHKIMGPGNGLNVEPHKPDGQLVLSLSRDSVVETFKDSVFGGPVDRSDPVLSKAKFLQPIELYVHCQQISRDTYYNGTHTDLLAIVPLTGAKFGDLVTYTFSEPLFEKLSGSTIHRLDLIIKDHNGTPINFHDYYIRFTILTK